MCRPSHLTRSLDHRIRSPQHRLRDRQAQRLGGLEVDHQLELGWLLDGEVGRLCSLEDFVDVDGGASEQVQKTRSIRHEPASLDELPVFVDRREPALCRETEDLSSMNKRKRI